MDVLKRIDVEFLRLSPAEQCVARWVRSHPRETIEAPLARLAELCDVSEPTVIRFCRSVGCTGYRALKAGLASVVEQPRSYLHQEVDASDATELAVGKVLDNAIRGLMDVRSSLNQMPFEDAASALANARQVVFVGVGASGHAAVDSAHKFFRLGVPCATATDAQTIAQHAAIATPETVFVVLSHTGVWPEVHENMALARDSGATVIAVTLPGSPLAQVCTWLFPCHPPEDTNVHTPMSSRLAQLAVLDALQVAMALALGADATSRLRRSKSVLAARRDGISTHQAMER